MSRCLPSFRHPAALVLIFGLVASACGGENTKLMVTGIDPDRGDSNGETYVRIKGNRFTADGPRNVQVFFGGQHGEVIRFESDSELVVRPPGGKPNDVVDVLIIFNPGGQLKIPGGYRYYERNPAGPSVDDLNTNKGTKDPKK
jgi:IPT/TIG domain-containing protein